MYLSLEFNIYDLLYPSVMYFYTLTLCVVVMGEP